MEEKKRNYNYTEYSIPSTGTNVVLSAWEAERADAVIVFMPATMVHPLFYCSLLQSLAERGFTVVGLHPIGHGKSPRDNDRYTFGDIIQNGKDTVSFAQARYGLPIITFGSSQGGIAAAALASEDSRISLCFPHNMLLTELPDSIGISRFPLWLKHVYRSSKAVFRFFAWLMPGLKLPITFYLKLARISTEREVWEMVRKDPLCLKNYSLRFLSSLFTAEFPGLTDGTLSCPIYLISDSGDQLFTPDYTRQVFDNLRAPHKEMVVFDFNDHMLMLTHPCEVADRLSGVMRKGLLILS